jgi:putative ABC transport system ATP-binding protein
MAHLKNDMNPHHESSSLLQCYNLTKIYTMRNTTLPVLKGVHLSVKRGEIVIIKGKSGVGKTTLLEILGGLARYNSGSVRFDNCYLEKLSGEELTRLRREKMSIIFQNFNLIPSWTVLENIEAALMHRGLSKSFRRKKVKMLYNDLGLEEKSDYLPSELSIGQQQRVAIARALVNDPILLLADEPTGEVDSETAQNIISYLFSLVKKKNVALLVTTHGNFPLKSVDRILHLEDGIIQPK